MNYHMKAYSLNRQKRLRPRFAAATRFTLPLEPAAPFRGALETQLELLKGRLLRELLAASETPSHDALLRRATDDAAALAWTTPFPLLLLPELVREKAESARHYARRQAIISNQ